MPTHVYKLARELDFDKLELVEKINALSLGFTVNNHMSSLTDEQTEACKSAFHRERAGARDKKRLGSGLIRRRSKRSKATPEEAALAPALATASAEFKSGSALPVVKPRSGTKAGQDAEEPVVQEVEGQPEDETPVVAEGTQTEEVAETAPEAVVLEEDAEPEVAAEVPDEVEAVQEAAAEEVEEVEEVSAEAAEAEEVGTAAPAAAEATTVQKESKDGMRPVTVAKSVRSKGQAQVLGRIDPDLLKKRLAAEGKNFLPPAKRTSAGSPGPRRPGSGPDATPGRPDTDGRGRRKKKATRRTVQGKDLYDRNAKIRQMHQRRRNKGRTGRTVVTQAAEHKRVIKVNEAILLSELARQMGVKGADVIRTLMQMGEMYTINQAVDVEMATVIAETYGYKVENVTFDITSYIDIAEETDDRSVARPPVVTIMGHVDHGKTSLLDAIRNTNVTAQEFGGITQHIGAYQVALDRGAVTFLDTPGHAAFTALRARGALATDIVVLVVAADDGVMPQTIEAINHAQAAGVPIIIAVNKMDKEGVNPDRIKQALTEFELVPEEWGGETQFLPVSALQGDGIDELLEAILLQAELLELTANPEVRAQGLVIESRLDTGLGPVATCLIQSGTLSVGDLLVSGAHYGRVRRMVADHGSDMTEAGPSVPVQVTGLSGVPEAGEPCLVVADESKAREIVTHVERQRRETELAKKGMKTVSGLEQLTQMMQAGELNELKVIIKGDVQGSVEALKGTLEQLGNEEVGVRVIHAAVGGITENDVNLAASAEAGAVIVGFNVRPESRAAALAEGKGVDLILDTVIYEIEDVIHAALEGMLKPIIKDLVVGHAEVRQTFHVPRLGTIAGCYVVDGKVERDRTCRVLRDGAIIYSSKIGTLRRFKDDVKEVKSGFECGLTVENFNDVKDGDIVELYELVEERAKL